MSSSPVCADGAGGSVCSLVLNWNRRDLTLECLASLRALDVPPGVTHRVLLVDNGSEDDSLAAVRAAYPEVELLALPHNLGFAGGMNAGLRRALESQADWTLLVNNDATVDPGMLVRLLGAAAAAQDGRVTGRDGAVGLLAPTIYFHDRPQVVWPSAGRRRRLTLAPRDTTAAPPSRGPYDVDWANGCCVLVAADLWRAIGLFDARYRFYYEDHDLALRARAAGWRLLHVPEARAWHRVAASTGEGSPRQRYLLARGSVPYFLSHTRGWRRAFIVAYRLGSTTRALGRSLLRGDGAVSRALLRGLRDGWADWLARRDEASTSRAHKAAVASGAAHPGGFRR